MGRVTRVIGEKGVEQDASEKESEVMHDGVRSGRREKRRAPGLLCQRGSSRGNGKEKGMHRVDRGKEGSTVYHRSREKRGRRPRRKEKRVPFILRSGGGGVHIVVFSSRRKKSVVSREEELQSKFQADCSLADWVRRVRGAPVLSWKGPRGRKGRDVLRGGAARVSSDTQREEKKKANLVAHGLIAESLKSRGGDKGPATGAVWWGGTGFVVVT